jgi:hypothetical protein
MSRRRKKRGKGREERGLMLVVDGLRSRAMTTTGWMRYGGQFTCRRVR